MPDHVSNPGQNSGNIESLLPSPFQTSLLDSLFDAVYLVDSGERIIYWNRGAEQLTGFSSAEVQGRSCSDHFPIEKSQCSFCTDGNCPLKATIADGRRREAEVNLRHKSGHLVPVAFRVAPVLDPDGKVLGAVEVLSDLTKVRGIERRMMELERLAFLDFLTGLPNRHYTGHKIQQAIEDRRRFGRSYGLLMLDLDHFKSINDTYGHNAGDELLKTMSRNLVLGLRAIDLVGRWGGEEFVILVSDANAETLQDFSERCRAVVSQTIVKWQGSVLRVTASVGATLLRDLDSASEAVSRADALMYRGKHGGGNRAQIEASGERNLSEPGRG